MRSALLIVLLQAHLAACCGPVVSRSPAINSSGAKARSDQRAKEPPKPSVPLVTWATEEPEEPRALEFTDSPPLASLPPTTEAPPPFPFHPYDPDESTGTDKALEPGDLPRDCADVQNSGISDTSGVYRIFRPSCLNPEKCGKDVSCDLQTDGGGWTIIQQREDGDMDFFRDWASYRNGFGDDHSFWIGE
uniref:Fibrinogen C-terminal domain-containing protein n=1 Tax=Plectus sambesii TaxID=2011161 RepID=A0A914WJJ1_9BILA